MTDKKIPTENVNLEQLGLINQGLLEISGELARRYNDVLKQAFGWECNLESFRIGKRGLSPEVAAYLKERNPDNRLLEFGENYLNIGSANRFMIVVSPDQRDAPLAFKQTSYEEGLYDEVYRQARHTIEDVTHSEALFGELEDGVSVFQTADDLLQLRTVAATLDTPRGTVGKYLALDAMLKDLNVQNALDAEYIARMQKLSLDLGNATSRGISKVFPITKEIHCFYAEFFKGVHCLRNFKNKDSLRTLYISHHQGKPRNLGEEVLSMDLHDKDLLSTLHRYKFLGYNGDIIGRRLSESEDEVLLSRGIDVIGITPTQRKREIIAAVKELPKSWHEMREIAKKMASTTDKIKDLVEDSSYETRLKLSEPLAKEEIINHMLAELDPTDTPRVYVYNQKKLVSEFSTLPLNRQRCVAQRLLEFKLNPQGGKIK